MYVCGCLVGGFPLRNVGDFLRNLCERSAKARAKVQALIVRGIRLERRASQCASLVLESCDFKLELHGLRKAAFFQLVHVMYYHCDESCDFTAGVGESDFAHCTSI